MTEGKGSVGHFSKTRIPFTFVASLGILLGILLVITFIGDIPDSISQLIQFSSTQSILILLMFLFGLIMCGLGLLMFKTTNIVRLKYYIVTEGFLIILCVVFFIVVFNLGRF